MNKATADNIEAGDRVRYWRPREAPEASFWGTVTEWKSPTVLAVACDDGSRHEVSFEDVLSSQVATSLNASGRYLHINTAKDCDVCGENVMACKCAPCDKCGDRAKQHPEVACDACGKGYLRCDACGGHSGARRSLRSHKGLCIGGAAGPAVKGTWK